MSWHKWWLRVIDVLTLLGYRCLGTYQLGFKKLQFVGDICNFESAYLMHEDK
jgi:hypothetical protein